MRSVKIFTLLFAIIAISFACTKDPDPILISGVEASGTSFEDGSAVTKDLNGASAAEDVPLNATITATFDKAVDGATVNSTNVRLADADGNDVATTVTSSGSTVTIDPTNDLLRGTLYSIIMNNLKASDEGALANTTRVFTTEGRAPVVVPNADNMIAYWTFDNVTNDETGDFPSDKVEAIVFSEDRFGQGLSAAEFDGDASIIEIPGGDRLMESDDFTLSFWVKTNNQDHVNADGNPAGHFVMGLAAFLGFQFEIPADSKSCKLATRYRQADGTTDSEDTWFPGDGKDKDNGGWQGWDFVRDLTGSGGVEGLLADKWAHIICVYNAGEKVGQMYINGELMKSFDFDLWPDGAPKATITGVAYGGVEPSELPILAFGFIHSSGGERWDDTPWGDYDKPTSNHFKGQLDDVRIFNAPYSEADVAALYAAEKN